MHAWPNVGRRPRTWSGRKEIPGRGRSSPIVTGGLSVRNYRNLNCRGGPPWPPFVTNSQTRISTTGAEGPPQQICIRPLGHGGPSPYKWDVSKKESRIWIELRVCDVACADWIHCNVVEVLLKVGVVAHDVVEEAFLPKTLFQKVFRLNSRPVS